MFKLFLNRWGVFFGLVLFSVLETNAQKVEDLIDISVIAEVEQVKPGDNFKILVQVELADDWHIYWKTAGETGYPTTVEWDKPEGFEIEEVLFPPPLLYEYKDLVSYIYKGKIYLLTDVRLPPNFERQDNEISISGQFSSLVCSLENCIPFDYEFSFELSLAQETVLNDKAKDVFQAAREQLAVPFSDEGGVAAILKSGNMGLEFDHMSISGLPVDGFRFFPEGDFLNHAQKQIFNKTNTDKLSVTLSVDSSSELPVGNIRGVLTHPALEQGRIVDLSIDQIVYGNSENKVIVTQPNEVLKIETEFNQLALMLGLIMIAMAIWLYGKTGYSSKPSTGKRVSRLISLFLLVFGAWFAYPGTTDSGSEQITWEVWSPEKKLALLEEGRGVFIDFTARWCMSCQVNKVVYKKQSVIEKFKELNIVPLQADWTKRGPVILEALQKYGREGVPLYVYYPPTKKGEAKAEPILLPEILTRKIVLEVIEDEEPYLVSEANSFVAILGFAFLGGIILNLMPCVFPVLGLKIMSFVKKAGEDATKVRNHGIIFTLGVLLSFWILVGVLLGLRETLQSDSGWGFQLQEPIFVFVLAVFLLIFALNLSGVFEIGMSFTGIGSKLSGKTGYIGSFFSGFLATIVATPCMAPFLGVAVGAALAMPWHSALVVFTSIALGLASPYLLLSLFPKWISRLPKPGAWMDTFKQAMAFPLYATVAWLLWTLNSLI